VFWSSSDPSAPVTAIKGLNSNSVITCTDCHSQITAAGPHGGSTNWYIDSNYPYPFKYAILGSSNFATNPVAANGGVPPSASGIKARKAAKDALVCSLQCIP
jgi:hypothetical protein